MFNYWEPLHYLTRGVGFQTWEYSPDYSIRSYFYLVIHTLPNLIAQQVIPHDKVLVLSPRSNERANHPRDIRRDRRSSCSGCRSRPSLPFARRCYIVHWSFTFHREQVATSYSRSSSLRHFSPRRLLSYLRPLPCGESCCRRLHHYRPSMVDY